MKLFFDTETTGLANFRAPASDPSQPRIVQLGAILVDSDRHVAGELNLIVKPDGWAVPAEAAAVHGITTERCERYGFKIATVVQMFAAMCNRAELVVAHNLDFDRLLVLSELLRVEAPDAVVDHFREMPGYCTMKAATHVCRIPSPRGAGYKWPQLQEAHRHFFNAEFDGAHDAMADVRACMRVYFALNGGVPAEAATA